MKTVTLFRHAKSGEKENPKIEDIDRPLSGRGLKAAPKMGAALRDRRIKPDLIFCSPSVRTRQTLTLASPEAWDEAPKTRFKKEIYEASRETLLQVLSSCPKDVQHVMIVGHNPGLQELAITLAKPGGAELAKIEQKLPTAAVVTFEFDEERWKDIQPATGRIVLFIAPRTLG